MDYQPTILIIEPNETLTHPYVFLPSGFILHRVPYLDEAEEKIKEEIPSLILISASFPPSSTVEFLEFVKNKFAKKITSVIFIVDLSHRINFIPGTSWGGKIAVVDNGVDPMSFFSTVIRLIQG